MNNLFDYLTWRGDLSFSQSPFNMIDALSLSQSAYLDLEGLLPAAPSSEIIIYDEVLNKFFKDKSLKDIKLGLILPDDIVKFSYKLKDSNRFANVYVSNYINVIDKKMVCQFSAMCFHINENDIYISFRGTDDSFIGWQENVNMLNRFPIPAQTMAAKYFDEMCERFPKSNFYIGGHSKGGNLAAYAAIYCSEKNKERIKNVYCFDSPGFRKALINKDKYELVKDKIINLMPKNAVIGLIFTVYGGKNIVCDAYSKGIKQHDAFTWKILGTSFVEVSEVTKNARDFDVSIKQVLANLSEEQIAELAKNIYDFIVEFNKDNLADVTKDSLRFVRLTNKITPLNKKIFMSLIYNLVKYNLL